MKVIIDLIEDIRESIGNAEDFELRAGLLKEDKDHLSKLIYAGEAPLNAFVLDESKKQLIFKIDSSSTKIYVGELLSHLLALSMDAMIYELKMAVNVQYTDVEIIGFGKNEEERSYILFIKL